MNTDEGLSFVFIRLTYADLLSVVKETKNINNRLGK